MLPDDRHGTISGYKQDGCRCDDCKDALYRYEKRRKYLADQGLPATVDATGFKRRVRALMALGWTHREIAERLSIVPGNLSNRMLYTKRVTRAMHEAMAAIYDELAMRLPPDEMVNRRTRDLARKKGYLPPLAFDDIDNDVDYKDMVTQKVTGKYVDHAVVWRVLQGEVLPTNKAERVEIMRRWLARGGSEKSLCERMGWRDGRYSPHQLAATAPNVHTSGDDFQDEREAS